MENENKALTQNFFNDNFKKAVYELILEGMKNDPDCAGTTIEDLKNDSQIQKMVDLTSAASSLSLTIDLICEKLNITEADGLAYIEKVKPQMLEMALKSMKN